MLHSNFNYKDLTTVLHKKSTETSAVTLFVTFWPVVFWAKLFPRPLLWPPGRRSLPSCRSKCYAPSRLPRRPAPPPPRPLLLLQRHVLSACARLGDLAGAENIKDRALKAGYSKDVFVCSALLHLYSRCGAMGDAVKVSDGMPKRDRVAWSRMVAGFVSAGSNVLNSRLSHLAIYV